MREARLVLLLERRDSLLLYRPVGMYKNCIKTPRSCGALGPPPRSTSWCTKRFKELDHHFFAILESSGINRIAHLVLARIRELPQILAARSHPDKRLQRWARLSFSIQYSDFTIFCQELIPVIKQWGTGFAEVSYRSEGLFCTARKSSEDSTSPSNLLRYGETGFIVLPGSWWEN